MTTIVRAADAAQFLSLVPRLLGFRPTRSLVLVPFEGARSLGAMRVDLPADTGPGDADRVAATFVGMICRIPAADAVAAVVYTDDAMGERMPRTDLIAALERRADSCGLRITDALCVGADGWGRYSDSEQPGGRPLDELCDPPAGAELIPVVDGDQASGADLPGVEPAEKEVLARALQSLDEAVALVSGTDAAPPATRTPKQPAGASEPPARVDPLALAAACMLDDLPTLFEDALTWDPLAVAPYDAAALAWCLGRPALRDIAIVEWCGGLAAGDEAFDAQLRWEAGEEYPDHLAMRMWGEGERPDPERLVTALTLVRRVAAAVPAARRPGLLATCAWLAWALGRSTHADLYASRACDLEPEHGLGEIVRSFVHAGHLPDWAFQRP